MTAAPDRAGGALVLHLDAGSRSASNQPTPFVHQAVGSDGVRTASDPTAWWTTAWGSVEAAGNPPSEVKDQGPAGTIKAPRGVISPDDEAAMASSSAGPRAIHEIGHRCPCGNPDVVTT